MICTDNDETGRIYARDVANSLLPVAASVKLLDFKAVWEDIPEGGDVSDYIELGGPSPRGSGSRS